jgi:hypothetical protein
MNKPRYLQRTLLSLFLAGSGHALAASGGFSTFTYNVAGLPEILSSATSSRQAARPPPSRSAALSASSTW